MYIKPLKELGILLFCVFVTAFVFSFDVVAQTSRVKPPVAKKNARTSKKPTSAKTKAIKIESITITGQKKIEKEAMLAKMTSQVGGLFSEKQVTEDIQALFKMGYFVQIEASKEMAAGGLNLEYKVVEKPIISEVLFEGNTEQKADDLEKETGLKNYEILNTTKIKEATLKLEKFYEDKGFYLVKIEPIIEDVKKDETVRIKFLITENDKVKVKKITLIGNNNLKDSYLKGRLFTQEAGFFSGLSSSGSFKQEAFERDIQVIKFLYWNLGYVQVKIDQME